MNITDSNTVAHAVTENIKAAHVFKKHGIDFCCGGGITIKKACEKNQVDLSLLLKELESLNDNSNFMYDYNKWDINFLIEFIVNTHHKYVEENLGILKQYVTKVSKVHGHHYTELIEIEQSVHEVSDELTVHMKKEELILFPFIKKLVTASKNNTIVKVPHFENVNNPITMLEEDHDNAGDVFKRISNLTNKYTTPEGACNTFKALYAKLEEFEDNLHQHVHLENNILFPKARKLENELNK